MIDKYALAKALLTKCEEVSTANNILLVAQGEKYERKPNVEFVEEFGLFGKDRSPFFADDSPSIQRGIYQININMPRVETGARWRGLDLANTYQAAFSRGTELTHESQMVRIEQSSLKSMRENDTHFIYVLDITYTVIN